MQLVDKKQTWFIFSFLLLVIFFATPYDFFISKNIIETDYEIIRQVEKGFLSKGNLFRSVSLFLLICFSIVSLMRKGRKHIGINGSLGFFIIFFLVLAFVSVFWTDDYNLIFKKLAVLFVITFGGFAIAERFSLKEIIIFVFFISVITLLISISSEIVLGTFHPFDPQYKFAGVLHPNKQSWNCAMLLIASMSLAMYKHNKKHFFIISAIFAFLFLILTKSRAAFFSGFVAIIILLMLVSSFRLLNKIIIITGIIAILMYWLIGDNIYTYSRNVMLLGRDNPVQTETLSGRVLIWKECFNFIAERPFLGYGYNAFWTPRHIFHFSRKTDYFLANAHNAYLETILSLGIVGVSVFIIILFISIYKSFKYYKFSKNIDYIFIISYFVWLCMNMFLESLTIGIFMHNILFSICLARLGFIERPLFLYNITKINKYVQINY